MQVVHSLRLKMAYKVSLWTWTKRTVVGDITGIPCAHAITYIFISRQDAEQYVHKHFQVSIDKAYYETKIAPINGQNI